MFVFSTSDFMIWIFCPQRNAILWGRESMSSPEKLCHSQSINRSLSENSSCKQYFKLKDIKNSTSSTRLPNLDTDFLEENLLVDNIDNRVFTCYDVYLARN